VPSRTILENQAVDAYLNFLATGTLPASKDNDQAIEVLDERIANEDRLWAKVTLIAERHRLANPPPPDPAPLVEKFIYYARTFSERNKITYPVWREMGVPPKVLKEAGIALTQVPKANGVAPTPLAPKLALDDPRRKRTYAPRRQWTPEARAELVAYLEANGLDATAEKYGYKPAYVQQFVADWKRHNRA